MKRNQVLMAIWVLCTVALLTSVAWGDRDRGRGHDQGSNAQRSAPPQRNSYTPSTGSGRPQSQSWQAPSRSAQPSAPTYTPRSDSAKPQSRSWQAPSRSAEPTKPTSTPRRGSWTAPERRTVTPTPQVEPTKPAFMPRSDASKGQGTQRQGQADKPAFTPRSDTWKGQGTRDRQGQADKPAFTPQAETWRGRGQGSGSHDPKVLPSMPSGRPQAETWRGQGPRIGDGGRDEHRGKMPRVMVDGDWVKFPSAPRMHDGHVVAPVRPFFDKIGARMWEDRDTHWWHARRGNHEFRFRLGDRHAWCGDRQIILVTPPYMYGGFVYCPLDPFFEFWSVPYRVEYIEVPVPVPVPAYVSEDLAVANATDYLKSLGVYPDRRCRVTVHENTAPANRFWDAVTSGQEPIEDAPMVLCWIVEFAYGDSWMQVWVDIQTGEPIGGSVSD